MSRTDYTISDSTFYLKITGKYRMSKRSCFPVMIFGKSSNHLLSQKINMDIMIKFNLNQYTFSPLIVKNKEATNRIASVLHNTFSAFFPGRQTANWVSVISFIQSLFSRFENAVLCFKKVLEPFFPVPVAALDPHADYHSPDGKIRQQSINSRRQIIKQEPQSHGTLPNPNVFLNIRMLTNPLLQQNEYYSPDSTVKHHPVPISQQIFRREYNLSPFISNTTEFLNPRIPANFSRYQEDDIYSPGGTVRLQPIYNIQQIINPVTLIKNSPLPNASGRYQASSIKLKENSSFDRWIMTSNLNSYNETQNPVIFIKPIFKPEHDKDSSESIFTPVQRKVAPVDTFYFRNNRKIEQTIETVKKIAQEAKDAAAIKDQSKTSIETYMKRHIDINILSDKVYQNIERRLRSERERRGM